MSDLIKGHLKWNMIGLICLSFSLFLLLFILCSSARAGSVTIEAAEGHQGEMQLRIGYKGDLSEHWQLDGGVFTVKYGAERFNDGWAAGPKGQVFGGDTTLLRKIWFGPKSYLGLGSGLAIWSHKTWGAQDSATLWMFSNRIGFNYRVTPTTELGISFRHYSNLCFSPNTSKDFVGAQVAFKF